MAGQFFVLIDPRDSEKFRKFKIKKFNESTNEILEKNNQEFIWSFHKSHIDNSIWKKIKKNDQIYFSLPKNDFKIMAHVSKKIIDKKIGKIMWPDVLNSEYLTHFLLFERIENISIPFNQLLDYSSNSLTVYLPGIYEIKTIFRSSIQKQKMISKKQFIAKPFVLPLTENGIPQKDFSEIMRFVRDSSKVKKLKKLYGNKCQICGYTFEYDKNKFYSEVHHYNPLKELADDDFDNMIVVCPNHHAEFDYNLIAINFDGYSIINNKGDKIGEIHFHNEHKLSKKNIQSQLKRK